jgi:hypothetical protein
MPKELHDLYQGIEERDEASYCRSREHDRLPHSSTIPVLPKHLVKIFHVLGIKIMVIVMR